MAKGGCRGPHILPRQHSAGAQVPARRQRSRRAAAGRLLRRAAHRQLGRGRAAGLRAGGLRQAFDDGAGAASESDAKLAQKLGQLQPFLAVFPQECMGQLASFGPT